jgi:hypothetical protein
MNEDIEHYERKEASKPFPNDYEEAERDYAELDNLTELFGEDDIVSYEVECPYCKTAFEVNIEEPFEVDCPECHKLVSSDFIR